MKSLTMIGLCGNLFLSLTACGSTISTEPNGASSTASLANGGQTTIEAKPWPYSREKQMVMKPLDGYHRAVDSHI